MLSLNRPSNCWFQLVFTRTGPNDGDRLNRSISQTCITAPRTSSAPFQTDLSPTVLDSLPEQPMRRLTPARPVTRTPRRTRLTLNGLDDRVVPDNPIVDHKELRHRPQPRRELK